MTKLTYVLTDIHGRLDLLEMALKQIEKRGGYKRLVFLGDYVDRGPDSRHVVERLMQLEANGNVVCLAGNHELMFINYLTSQTELVDMFLESGGRQALGSYADEFGYLDIEAMSNHAAWMKNLPLWYRDEQRIYVHAGIRPGEAVETQHPSVLTWSRMSDFFGASRASMGAYVVHGHTPVHDGKDLGEIEVTSARTNLDTGAHKTGKLAIGVFDDSQEKPIEVFSVFGPRPLAPHVREERANRASASARADANRHIPRPPQQAGGKIHALAARFANAVSRGRL